MESHALEERDRELGVLAAALDGAAGGRGATVVIEGPPGIGKTRLVRELPALAERVGAQILQARAAEGESDFAYGVARQLFERRLLSSSPDERDALLAGAAALAGPLLGVPAGEESAAAPDTPDPAFASLHGLYWLTSNLAAEKPLVLLVDDAHWADAPSLRFLDYLARRVADLPALVVVATRPQDPAAAQEALASLIDDPAAEVLRPSTLSLEAVVRLAETALGESPDASFVEACFRVTGGNPFYVMELLEALARDGIKPRASEADRVGSLGPRTVVRSVIMRISRLPAGTERVAAALAVLGRDASLGRVSAIAGISDDEAVGAVDALAGSGLLAPGGGLGFVHPIVEAAVASELGPGESAQLHGRAAELLREEGLDAGRVARHLLLADLGGREWAPGVLREAAAHAVDRGGPEIAVRMLRRALAEPPPEEERQAIVGQLGAAELRAGDPQAIEHLREAIGPGSPPEERVRRAQLLGRALAAAGLEAQAVDALAELADDVRAEAPESAMLLDGDQASIGLMEPALAPRARERLAKYSAVEGSTHAERVLLVGLAHQSWVAGESVEAARSLARKALAGGALLRDETADSIAYYQAVYALVITDALDEAEEHLAASIDNARQRGLVYGFAASSSIRALARLRAGQVDRAEADARAALEVVEHNMVAPMALGYLAMCLAERDGLDEAEELLHSEDLPDPLPTGMAYVHVTFARGLVQLLRGKPEEAHSYFADTGQREDAFGVGNPIRGWRLMLAATTAARGDVEGARALVEDQLARARQWGSPAVTGWALRSRAYFLEGEEAIAARREAVETLRQGVDKLELARALRDLGASLRRAGARVEARAPLTESLDLSRQLGARELAARAHKELEVAGAKPRRLQFSGVESLTAAERRVVDMAAAGHTNREIAQSLFVTAKTVENHLGRAYRKLDVQSRDQLAAALSAEPVPA